MYGDQESSKENQVQVDKTKSIFSLLSSDQKRYSLLLNQPRGRENVVRDEYPFTNILALYLLILSEGGIQENQQSPTYENRGGVEEDTRTKSALDTLSINIKKEKKTTPIWYQTRTGHI